MLEVITTFWNSPVGSGEGLWVLRSANFALVSILVLLFWQRTMAEVRRRDARRAVLYLAKTVGALVLAAYLSGGMLIEREAPLLGKQLSANLGVVLFMLPSLLLELGRRGMYLRTERQLAPPVHAFVHLRTVLRSSGQRRPS